MNRLEQEALLNFLDELHKMGITILPVEVLWKYEKMTADEIKELKNKALQNYPNGSTSP